MTPEQMELHHVHLHLQVEAFRRLLAVYVDRFGEITVTFDDVDKIQPGRLYLDVPDDSDEVTPRLLPDLDNVIEEAS